MAQQARNWSLGHPWDQSSWYRAACRQTLLPGERASYRLRRVNPANPRDVTAFHPGQDWTPDSMPDVLYVLYAPTEWAVFRSSGKPRQKRDGAGNLMWGVGSDGGRAAILDFAVLPDRIGTRESFFVIEAWRRLDPRIDWEDILMRMRGGRPTINNLQQQSARHFRRPCSLVAWDRRGQQPDLHEQAVLNRLTAQQLAARTTRGLTPGLLDPRPGHDSACIPTPDTTRWGWRRGEYRDMDAQAAADDAGDETTWEDGDDEDNGSDDEPGEGPSSGLGGRSGKRARTEGWRGGFGSGSGGITAG